MALAVCYANVILHSMIKKVFSALLLLVISLSLFAQQGEVFSVVGFTEKPFDTAARDERYRLVDGNGELFSIIKLVSNTAGDNMRAYSFDFGLCESRVKEIDGEVWVYVQRNAMRAKIRREGYNTVTYELPVTVQPGRVYELALQATHKVVKKRYVLFKVQPADSKVLILFKADGEKEYKPFGAGQVNDEGLLSDKLVLGRYFYKLTSQNYHLSEGVIELVDGQGPFTETVTLRPNWGTVTLIAEGGAEIFVDGESKGFGTWTGQLTPGFYNVECRKQNHRNEVDGIEVKEGKSVTVKLKSPQLITGALDITTDPLEAIITIDGKECGKTPTVIDGIVIGTHKVTLSKSGYTAVDLEVEIKDGETNEQFVMLGKRISNSKSQTTKTVTVSSGKVNGHEYVDLGLSVKWATCTVGATEPEEYGGYYAWGETEGKSNYVWSTYKWCKGSSTTMTKYCTSDNYGTVDNKDILDIEDDVANVEWGSGWRMPTKDELDELCKKCKLKWITQNGVKGYKVTGTNGNSIFLPAAGYFNGMTFENQGCNGYYWSSSLYSDGCYYAFSLFFYDDFYGCSDDARRYGGYSVRPVCE